jgi:hypothetical protein
MSEDIRELGAALLRAKNQFKHIEKSGENSHQRYEYARIGDIYNAIEGALMENNILVVHAGGVTEKEYLITRLIHVPTGQFMQDVRLLESEKPGNQAKGATNTYMRKYALLSLCALSTEDDDGAAESEHINEKPLVSTEQVQELIALIKECGDPKKVYSDIRGFNKINDLYELKRESFNSVKSYITKARDKK